MVLVLVAIQLYCFYMQSQDEWRIAWLVPNVGIALYIQLGE